jgi:hypothetical protein
MNRFDLSKLKWNVSGYAPLEWECGRSMELGTDPKIDTFPVPAKVPGSVQAALLDAGIVPDWNVGLNSKQLEWVENRHWLYETTLSADWFSPGKKYRLRACGLDSAGTIYLNGKAVYKLSMSLRYKKISLKMTAACRYCLKRRRDGWARATILLRYGTGNPVFIIPGTGQAAWCRSVYGIISISKK